MQQAAGIVSMGAYLPAKRLHREFKAVLVDYLKEKTLLHHAYIDKIDKEECLPGEIETNYDGWQSQPWFKTWLANLPESKQADPFQGARERRRVPHDPDSVVNSLIPHPMLPSDAETLAGAIALLNGQIDSSEIDQIITSSQVPDLPLPPNASLVQHKLQLGNAGAYEIDTCCSSFVTMLEIAEALIIAGIKKKVLIVASYIDSLVSDRSDYFSVNTGDAAIAAVVTSVRSGMGYSCSHSTSHGSRHNGIILQRRSPQLGNTPSQRSRYEQEFVTFYNPQATKEIAANSTRDMKEVVDKALSKAGLSISNIDFFVTHQPVHWAGKAWQEALEIPENRFYESFQKYGNIANCSAAVNLFEAIENGLIKEGDLVLIASSGAGENHIALVERITPQVLAAVKAKGLNIDVASRLPLWGEVSELAKETSS